MGLAQAPLSQGLAQGLTPDRLAHCLAPGGLAQALAWAWPLGGLAVPLGPGARCGPKNGLVQGLSPRSAKAIAKACPQDLARILWKPRYELPQ